MEDKTPYTGKKVTTYCTEMKDLIYCAEDGATTKFSVVTIPI